MASGRPRCRSASAVVRRSEPRSAVTSSRRRGRSDPSAGLHAMNGSFDLARELLADSQRDLRRPRADARTPRLHIEAVVGHAWPAIPPPPRARFARVTCALEGWATGRSVRRRPRTSPDAVFTQGRDDEAEEPHRDQRQALGAGDDLLTQILWRGVRAKVMARRGRIDEAEELAREAVAISASTDFLNSARRRSGSISRRSLIRPGRLDETKVAAAEGVALYEQKGNRVAAAKARTDLAVLDQV